VRPYVIIVEFDLVEGRAAEFGTLILENASASLAEEPGCRQFDVLVPESKPHQIVLYEIYDDEAAFDLHVRSAHFKKFDAQSRDLVAGKRVIRLDMASPYEACPASKVVLERPPAIITNV
jgi:(4S)-4-hydroxy-5-phosphonooxypentane-2,3-dione isomerase